MEIEFQTICEDESPQEIGRLFVDMWRQCCIGDFTLATNALAREYARHAVLEQSKGINADDDEMDESEDTVPDLIAENGHSDICNNGMDQQMNTGMSRMIDEEGFETVVRGRKSKGRK